MENVKILRKVKKLSNAQQQRQQQLASQFSQYLDQTMNCDTYHHINNNRRDYFSELSDEILLNIFRYIPKPLLLRYAVVCKRWNRLMGDESLWRRYDLSNRTINAEILIKLLNRGVKMFGLGRSELKKSSKKHIIYNNDLNKYCNDLSTQLDVHLNLHIKLEYLDLTNTNIDINSLNSLLKHCKHLRKISIESLDTTIETYSYLSINKTINTLNLCMVRGINVESLILILNNLKNLRSLNIGWTNLDRECVVLLCKYLPKTLEKLNITGCKTTLLDSDIENLVQSCPNLIQLDLSDAQSLTAKTIELITDNLEKIEYLAFSRCYSILPSSYLMLSKLQNLIAIDLFNILKEKSIETLKACVPSLIYVNKYPFSSIARPIVGFRRTSIWGCRINDNEEKGIVATIAKPNEN